MRPHGGRNAEDGWKPEDPNEEGDGTLEAQPKDVLAGHRAETRLKTLGELLLNAFRQHFILCLLLGRH